MDIYIMEDKVFAEIVPGYLLYFATLEEFCDASEEDVTEMISNAMVAKQLESQM